MIFFRLLEIVFSVFVLLFFWTQIIGPALRKTLFFPYFRKEGDSKKEEVVLNQRDFEKYLKYKIEARKHPKDKGDW